MKGSAIVVGGGPAGYSAALRLRRGGMDVTLIEKDDLGGTCVNRGCIPTRSYLQSIKVRDQMRCCITDESSSLCLRPQAMRRQAEAKIQKLSFGIEYVLRKSKVSVEKGEVCRIGDRSVELSDGRRLECDVLLVATGSAAKVPTGWDGCRIFDGEELLTLKHLPDSITVVGAGVFGTEMSVILRALGVQVRLIEKEQSILPGWDEDIRRTMENYLRAEGIEIACGETEKQNSGNVVFCCGREPVFPCPVEQTEENRQWIFVIGDASGGPMTADRAMAEGRATAERILDIGKTPQLGPSARCIFTPLEAATTGCTAGPGLREGYVETGNTASGGIFNCFRGFVKAVVEEKTHIIRGFHIVSFAASEIIQIGQMAAAQEMTAEAFCSMVFPHPTEGELLQDAVRRAL